MKSEQVLRKAEQAKSLLDNELLQEAFTKLKTQFMKEWEATKPDDVQRREDAWRMIKCVDKVESTLEGYVINGQFENDKVTKIKKGVF